MRTIHKALRYVWFATLAASLLVSAGCKKKKPAVPPPQAQAPTITPAPQPATQPTTTETQPPTATEPIPSSTTAAPTEKPPEATTPVKPAPTTTGRRNHRTTAKTKAAAPKAAPPTASTQTQTPPAATTKPPSQPAAGTEANTQTAAKTPTPAPPPSPPPSNSQIAPGMSPVDEYHNKQTTAQLIERCEAGLKGINRNLSDEEKATLSNIRNFITQARNELASGDIELAHNYASKAHQLCEELVKH